MDNYEYNTDNVSDPLEHLQESGNKLINIDNGGTLTDIFVMDGQTIYKTKTLTTPYDLSKCLFEALKKISVQIYGKEDVTSLLLSTRYIRYSTTQGTNALIERKGPRLGLIVDNEVASSSTVFDDPGGLFNTLVGDRITYLEAGSSKDKLDSFATGEITRLSSLGASRIVVVARDKNVEKEIKGILLKRFPQHLLGALPVLYSHEIAEDGDDVRRTWTSLINAFLHPAMERFLYRAEHKLRDYGTGSPLLIFRNDGYSSRVAKTTAIKTYSSGPRGGAEGIRALARHYDFSHLLSMDIGGTTTDILEVSNGELNTHPRGKIEGIETSFPFTDFISAGIGGSSVCNVSGDLIQIGPESVGSEPGPACFGLGGTDVTVTDALLVAGVFDPATYFGGELQLDTSRAHKAVNENIASPLGISVEAAALAVINTWVDSVAGHLKRAAKISPETTLVAFGGAGPMLAPRIAEAVGIKQVVIPSLAPVFSAFGIGFSDIAHEHQIKVVAKDRSDFSGAYEQLLQRAARSMHSEKATLESCEIRCFIQPEGGDEQPAEDSDWALKLPLEHPVVIRVLAIKPIPHTRMEGDFSDGGEDCASTGTRIVGNAELPLYALQSVGIARGKGAAVLEDEFFTLLLDSGWTFRRNNAGDLLLERD